MKQLFFETVLLGMLLFVVACSNAPIAPTAAARTETLVATALPSPASEPTTAASATVIPDVPREQTLVLGAALEQAAISITNPWATLGYVHSEGNNLLWEGLSYYGIFADKEIPWLADSMEYTKPDSMELTFRLNKNARWSDGR